jgi:hypothetical protein
MRGLCHGGGADAATYFCYRYCRYGCHHAAADSDHDRNQNARRMLTMVAISIVSGIYERTNANQERADGMIVGGLQGGDIALAQRAGMLQIVSAPRKPLTPRALPPEDPP